jgi:hypothetical protein
VHIIRLDIDRKNSTEHLQIGPLQNGLNAIYAPVPAGSDTMARFVRSLLFRGTDSLNTHDDEFYEALDGSLQWVDASGHVRMMSTGGGANQTPNRFVHSPLHPSERPIHADDRDSLRDIGNCLWEGDQRDHRWDELRGDILGMVFCSPLGTLSPEKLWWAASRLGVHTNSKSEPDEGYQRLKAEELELLERLRNIENVDHDRAWWSLERDRIAAELNHLQIVNLNALHPAVVQSDDSATAALRERLVSVQIEIAKLRSQIQDLMVHDANTRLDSHRRDDVRMNFSNVGMYHSSIPAHSFASTNGRPVSNRADLSSEHARLQIRIEHLVAEQANVEAQLRGKPIQTESMQPARRWDDSQLRAQLAHAEEMIRRWDRRTQSHRRLSEIQSHLRTRSPFRRTTEGSLIPKVEKYLRDLTSGAARQLPAWAVEASYLQHHENYSDAYHSLNMGQRSGYYDRMVPTESTLQRKWVDLAIRLAIADAAVARIGRIPMLLDDSISAFRGESLEQVLHVLATFARDGRQMLVSTKDEYTARRIAAHGGTVCRMQEIMRYARPNYRLDSQVDLGLHPAMNRSAVFMPNQGVQPLRVVGYDASIPIANYEIGELNRQLTGLANEQAVGSWWVPDSTYRTSLSQPRYVESTLGSAAGTSSGKRTFLQMESNVSDVPGTDALIVQRLHSAGIYRVGDLLRANATNLGASLRVDTGMIEHMQQVADLMCSTPQLRAFDAQVLVGCGINRPNILRDLSSSELVDRVERFLNSFAGQDLSRRASSFEVSRINSWIADIKRSNTRRRSQSSNGFASNDYMDRDGMDRSQRSDRSESSDRSDRRSREGERIRFDREHNGSVLRPRVMRSTEYDNSDRRNSVDGNRSNQSSSESSRSSSSRSTSSNRSSGVSHSGTQSGSQWKFYLDIDSPIVDAPSIGPRMAEKLAPLNIITVGDLIASDAANVATQLADKNVTVETVQQWQQQALLVCRIPNLRGHDSQLLVGSGYLTAEEVAAASPQSMLDKVSRFASSKAGVRYLRGSAAPDATEVTNWIQWSQNCRAIRAA